MSGNQLPYNTRNMEERGRCHGSGLPGKVGQKKGGYTDAPSTKNRKTIGKPPRKMN